MIEEVKEEGVKFKFLAQPKSFEGSENRVAWIVMDAMQLGKPDQSGRRHPEPIPGKEFKMKCSAVLLAIGRGPNSFLQKKLISKWASTIQLQLTTITRRRWTGSLPPAMSQAEKRWS
jgi:NADPH-dependent glutamate synthase beta subunit-like oxidoreductase